MKMMEERISNLEDRITEIMQTEEDKKNVWKKYTVLGTWGTYQNYELHVT